MDNQDVRTLALRKVEELFSTTERYNSIQEWEDISTLVLGDSDSDFNSLEGDVKNINSIKGVYTSVGISANSDLAATLHSTITNPSVKWMVLRHREKELNNDKTVMKFLQDLEHEFFSSLGDSNFNSVMPDAYKNLTALGNIILVKEYDKKSRTWMFTEWPLAHCAFEENADGKVDTVARRLKMTYKNLLESFKENLTQEEVSDILQKDLSKEVIVYNLITPTKVAGVSYLGADGNGYRSIYICKEIESILSNKTKPNMGVYVSRWDKKTNRIYGTGQGRLALNPLKVLNRYEELSIKTAELQISPPLFMDAGNVVSGSVKLKPGSYNELFNSNGFRFFQPAVNLSAEDYKKNEREEEVRKYFFEDKIHFADMKKDKTERTAFELAQRLEQMSKSLGGSLSRLQDDFLSKIVIDMLRDIIGRFEIPEILKDKGIDLDVQPVNQLARAQQSESIQNISVWLQRIFPLIELNNGVIDLIDLDAIVLNTARDSGVPEYALRDSEQVSNIREQASQQQQTEQAVDAVGLLGKLK